MNKMSVRQKITKHSKEYKNHKPTNKNKTPWSLFCIGQLFLGLGPAPELWMTCSSHCTKEDKSSLSHRWPYK